MFKSWTSVGTVIALLISAVVTLENGLARTPPMGWLAWERFRCNTDCKNDPDNCISENLFRTMADIVVNEGYADVGYEYINVDDCWLEKERNQYGELVPDRTRFPRGMKALADYIHAKGLKFGIYEDFGNYTCAGYPGVIGHLQQDAETFYSWDVDYVKLDGCYAHPSEMDRGYPEFGFYLNQTGRQMLYSCSWPVYQIYSGIAPNFTSIIQHCNLWRNFDDIQDSWASVENIIDYYGNNQDVIVPNAGPGHWNDPDMLIIGNFGLSYEQSKTQMAIWAILAAPLLMSVDLRTIRPEYKAILQNRKIISVDQDPLGIQGRRIYKHKGIEIWSRPITPLFQNYFSYAIAFLNRRTDGTPSDVAVTLKELGLTSPSGYRVEDLYEDVDYGVLSPQTKIKVKVNPSVTNNNAGSSTSGFTAEKALALLMDAQLSKHQYNVLKKACDDIGHNIFPCYNKILDAKKTCYPSNVEITETSATVPLQSLLDHTVTRIFEAKTEEEMSAFSNEMTLISKWGCDGSSGHSEYKQTFSDSEHSDSSLFLTSLVPLTLHQKNDLRKEFWANIRPSSTRLCRPIKFEFIKETGENTKREVARVEEIKNLNDTVLIFQEREFKIAHTLLFTMIDGKIAQTLPGTSSMAVCCICKAKPSEMNNLDKCLLKEVNIDAFRFGMHPLHARIKFMECILHIAYNKDFQSWKTNKDTKVQKEATKRQIQEKFQEILGLKVDFVKQGMGTSNDGNTSRRFFSNPDITSEITGVDKDLIYRFSEILNKINSQDEINAVEFGNYCLETARLYIRLYDWYYMPNSVHKILLHGKEIILAAMLPIGKLTEEAQEARNKDYRNYRLNHSRKCSRISTNTDIFNMLFASSDPYLLKYRKEPKT